ncbi:MAG TPA: isocitrate lyase/phosphoenolpyruvate mutase family protein [Dongiaceae bacterium]|jgi:methylisocitrate lyase|nr:isocitrate lyase/phosphoenolpyruvate mutase family protein [Dongiaceae bacterium]
MSTSQDARRAFAGAVAAEEIVILPGIQDALSARLAQLAGAKALYAGCYALHAGLLGEPDFGQLGLAELTEHYRRICARTSLPVLAEAGPSPADTTQIGRAVRLMEQAGIAGLVLEDQLAPRRSGLAGGKKLIPVVEMLARLKAALDARQENMMIVARTGAREIEGLEAATERAQLYRAAGADMLIVEAPLNAEEMSYICAEIPGPCLASVTEGGRSPALPAYVLEEIGYAAVAFPTAATFLAAQIWTRFYAGIVKSGDSSIFGGEMLPLNALNEVLGLAAIQETERRSHAYAIGLLERAAQDEE